MTNGIILQIVTNFCMIKFHWVDTTHKPYTQAANLALGDMPVAFAAGGLLLGHRRVRLGN